MQFTVKRSEWWRGRGAHWSFLLHIDDMKCCIGFVGLQCGIEKESLLGKATVLSVEILQPEEGIKFPCWMQNPLGCIAEVYKINDDVNLTDKYREEELRHIFASHGDSIEFVD